MPRYRKKPVEIEARLWDGSDRTAIHLVEWIERNGGEARYAPDPPVVHSSACQCDGLGIVPGAKSAVACPETEPTGGGRPALFISTLEGEMRADPGDRVIRGVEGEFYPCKPGVFAATYEPVD